MPATKRKPREGRDSPSMSPHSQHPKSIGFISARGRCALSAARLASERPERVEIDPGTGRITVIIAKAGEGAAGVWGQA